ncbi:Uncharacterised protein [Mycobacteroides abscessus subsp. abscessus]|nr:Uncharacterised protein [Mycobacteroides abscessus subsp. abscessus]
MVLRALRNGFIDILTPFPVAAHGLADETMGGTRREGRRRLYLARSTISTSRQRFAAETGRVSATTTRSPIPAVFSSS